MCPTSSLERFSTPLDRNGRKFLEELYLQGYTQGAKLYACWQTDLANYKNVSYVDEFYSLQGTSLGWTRISISCTRHVTGGQSSPTVYIHGNSQNGLINLKCMSIYSLGYKEKKVNYMKFILYFVLQIEVKITKGR